MSQLVEKITEETTTLSNPKQLCFKIIKHINWGKDFTFEKIISFLQLSNIFKNKFPNPIFEKN